MTHKEYEEYCARVEGFVVRVTDSKRFGAEPPHFTRFSCDVCHNPPGLRIEMVGVVRGTGELIHFESCLDCAYCLEHGKPQPRLHRIK